MRHSFPVLEDDYGIRPAGATDACFYCNARVGEPHHDDCVIIRRTNTYRVFAGGRQVAIWKHDEPVSWDNELGEFQKNEGSWCADNILDDDGFEHLRELIPDEEGACLCGVLVFRIAERGRTVFRAGPDGRDDG